MNNEENILNSINDCIIKSKKYLTNNNNNKYRTIGKAINGLLFINNIKYYISVPIHNNNNPFINISIYELKNYFNSFNTWFLFPEYELCLIVPNIKINMITPTNLWNLESNFTSPIKLSANVWVPEIQQNTKTSDIIILKTPINSFYINNNNLGDLLNNTNLINNSFF